MFVPFLFLKGYMFMRSLPVPENTFLRFLYLMVQRYLGHRVGIQPPDWGNRALVLSQGPAFCPVGVVTMGLSFPTGQELTALTGLVQSLAMRPEGNKP